MHLRHKPVDFDDLAHVCVKRSGAAAGLSGYLDYLSTYFMLLQSRTAMHAATLPNTGAVAAPMPTTAPLPVITTLFSLRLWIAPSVINARFASKPRTA